MQAIRYHFISRREIKIMIILVNVFTLISVLLYVFNLATPMAFLVGSFLWIVLMVSFWFLLPGLVYRKTIMFKHEFSMRFEDEGFTLIHEKVTKTFPWKALKFIKESPLFFFLYFDNKSFWLVPKDGCRNDDEVFELRQILKNKVGMG